MSASGGADGRRARLVEVRRVERLTPGMVRIVFGGDLADFDPGPFADAYLKVQFPVAGAGYAAPYDLEELKARLPRERWPRTRSYTVRAWDADAAELTLDLMVHGEGVAGAWAAAARPGDRLQLAGPGGAYAPDPSADWHLLVGDLAVAPAIAVALERLPPDALVHVILGVDGPGQQLELPAGERAQVRWVDAEELPAAVAALAFPPGRVHAFVHGEAGAVRAIRRHLVVERGVPKDDLSASGYWKRRRTDEGWREDKAEWKRLVAEDERATRSTGAATPSRSGPG